MFLQVVAKEQEHSDKVRREEGGAMRQAGRQAASRQGSVISRDVVVLQLKCLNYAPGPMDTEMQADVRGAPDTDRVSKQWFIDMHAQVSSSSSRLAHRGCGG